MMESSMTPSMGEAAAKKFVLRMTAQGAVKLAGPRTGCYFNLVADRDGPQNRVFEVVQILYPDAVVVGASVLHAYGWITQIPRKLIVAVGDRRRSLASIDGVEILQRPRDWFHRQQSQQAILRLGESPFPLDSLTPRAALDDVLAVRDSWSPDEDDLSLPEDEEEGVIRAVRRPRERG